MMNIIGSVLIWNVIVTILQIILFLIPVVWGISLIVYLKKKKFERLFLGLSFVLLGLGVGTCLNSLVALVEKLIAII